MSERIDLSTLGTMIERACEVLNCHITCEPAVVRLVIYSETHEPNESAPDHLSLLVRTRDHLSGYAGMAGARVPGRVLR